MCQVTRAICHTKTDETHWKEYLTSENHLRLCKNVDQNIAKNFFEKIFESRLEKKKMFNLKIDKTLNFWRLYFSTKLAKMIFDFLM